MIISNSTKMIVILAVVTVLNASISAQPAEVRIVVTPEPGSAIYTDFTHGLDLATPVGSTLRFTCQYRSEQVTSAVVMPWILYSPDNSISTGTRIENVQLIGQWATANMWSGGPQLNTGLIDGVLPDIILAGGISINFGEPNTGGGGFQNSEFIDFVEWTVTFDSSGIFCTDSSLFPNGANWLAIDENDVGIGPLWFGGGGDLSVGGTRTEAYCVNILPEDCCATPGDANHDGNVNIADPTYLVSRIFGNGAPAACCREGDANGDGRMNIADITYMVRRFFAGGPAPVCGGPVDNC